MQENKNLHEKENNQRRIKMHENWNLYQLIKLKSMDTLKILLPMKITRGFCTIFLPIRGICYYRMKLKESGKVSWITILSRILSIVLKMIRN